MPRVSIIIPVFNVEDYLDECLESILGQDLRDIEVICVDDGSEDSSAERLRAFAELDTRVVVMSQPNSGQSVARNRGIAHATGDYIWCVDSDDIVEVGALSRMLNLADQTGSDLVYGGASWFTEGLVDEIPSEGESGHYGPQITVGDYPSGAAALAALVETKEYAPMVWLLLVRRTLAQQSDLRYNEYAAPHEDAAYAPRAFLLAGRTALTSEELVRHRIRAGSVCQVGITSRRYLAWATVYLDLVDSFLSFGSDPRMTVIGRNLQNRLLKYARSGYEVHGAGPLRARPANPRFWLLAPALCAIDAQQRREDLLRSKVEDVELHLRSAEATPVGRTMRKLRSVRRYLSRNRH